MTIATIVFVVLVACIIGGTSYALRWAGNRADDEYMSRVLDDAEWATRADRPTMEAEAVSMASAGWGMPDYADHAEAARRTLELYDLEHEMLADLDEAIAVVESWA